MFLKSEFQAMISQLPPDNPISKNMSDIIDQIDEIETGELKISCDRSRLGYFNKNVTIRSKPVMETI